MAANRLPWLHDRERPRHNESYRCGVVFVPLRSRLDDIDDWRRLAREVESLFGQAMAEDSIWEEHLTASIQRGTAWCVRDTNHKFAGGMLPFVWARRLPSHPVARSGPKCATSGSGTCVGSVGSRTGEWAASSRRHLWRRAPRRRRGRGGPWSLPQPGVSTVRTRSRRRWNAARTVRTCSRRQRVISSARHALSRARPRPGSISLGS